MTRCAPRSIAWAVALLLTAGTATAQGTRADYDRATNLYTATFGSVPNARVVPHWTADGTAFWYATADAAGRWQYWWVDATAGTRRLAVDPAKFAAAWGRVGFARVWGPENLEIEDLDALPGGKLRVAVDGFWLTVDPATYAVSDETAIRDADVPHPLARSDVPLASDWAAGGEDLARVVVVNRTGGPVRLEWYKDASHRETIAADIDDSADKVFNLWSGEALAVVGAAGRTLGYWRADGDGGMIVVDRTPTVGDRLRSAARSLLELGRPTSRPTTNPTRRPTTGPTTRVATTRPSVPGASPDGRWVAFTRDHNVWLRDRNGASRSAVQLTRDGTAADGYELNQVLCWSPDSAALVALRWTAGGDRRATYVRSSPPDEVQPRVETIPYPVPGDRIGHYWPHLFDVGRRREVPITGVDAPDPEMVTEPAWDHDPTHFIFDYDRRGHQSARSFRVETATGRGRTVIEERSDTFIDRDLRSCWYDSDVHQQLWTSERDGYNHLYRNDARDGRLMNQVTKGRWVVRKWDDRVDQVDPTKSTVYFRAAGVDPAQDPYYVHCCRANLDGSGFQDLTPADGTHAVQASPGGKFYLDTYSRVDQPPVTELRRYSDGGLVCPLERADWSPLLLAGWRPPERLAAKGRDGKTKIYGVIYRPTNFDPSKKYPVVEDIYAGPQEASVPKAFTRWCYPMAVAELGFVVVQIDGMGTPGRGKAFHDVCWHNWADCGLPDRIAWIKAAAAAHSEMDLTRVGVYGGSFGGYAAVRALEDHGDFYKVAVAQDGCHDPRLYSQWYGEQFLGWPVGPWYADQSNAAGAARVAGPLLLIADELDRNVDPVATMRLAAALERADKDFDLLVIPNADHGRDGTYGDRRRKDFLVRHLLGVEPRAR